MLRKTLALSIFCLFILAASCSSGSEKIKYVLAKSIEIQFYDTLNVDDWISIDGLVFEHLNNYEMLKEDSIPAEDFYKMNVLPTTLQGIVIPGAEGHQFLTSYNSAELAYELFKHLAIQGNKNGQIYKFSGNSLDMTRGKLVFSRNDGDKIKVSTSDGYGAAVKKLN